MAEIAQSCPSHRSKPARRPFSTVLFEALASVRFAVGLIVVIALACVVGTLLPQDAEVAAYVKEHPATAARMEAFGWLGLTHVYSSSWFLVLLGLLASSVATCGTRRIAVLRRTTGFAWRRALGSMFAHASILLILAGGVIRGVWGEKGYIELREGQTTAQFQMVSGSRTLPFGLHLTKFEVETYGQPDQTGDSSRQQASKSKDDCCSKSGQLLVDWADRRLNARIPVKLGNEQLLTAPGEPATAANSFRIKVVKYVPDFFIDSATREVRSRSEEPKNPAILVEETGPGYRAERWLFAQFPDFTIHGEAGQGEAPSPLRLVYQVHGAAETRPATTGRIKSFKSTLKVMEGSSVVEARTIEVNRPFTYKGYCFYQSGYNPEDPAWTSLEVVRDPGVPLVYAGFSLLIIGLFIVFYLNPWLAERGT